MKPVSYCIGSDTPVVSYKQVGRRCPFCFLSVQNLTRHILAVHADEPEVKEIMDGCFSDLDRRQAFARNKGIIVLNRELCIAGKSNIRKTAKDTDVIHCCHCNGS